MKGNATVHTTNAKFREGWDRTFGPPKPDGWDHVAVWWNDAWRCVWCSEPCTDHTETHKEPRDCPTFYDFCHCSSSMTTVKP